MLTKLGRRGYSIQKDTAEYEPEINDRIMSLVAVADSAWSLEWDHGRSMMQGTHGYVPSNKDMPSIPVWVVTDAPICV